jgi:hypothetical protein
MIKLKQHEYVKILFLAWQGDVLLMMVGLRFNSVVFPKDEGSVGLFVTFCLSKK